MYRWIIPQLASTLSFPLTPAPLKNVSSVSTKVLERLSLVSQRNSFKPSKPTHAIPVKSVKPLPIRPSLPFPRSRFTSTHRRLPPQPKMVFKQRPRFPARRPTPARPPVMRPSSVVGRRPSTVPTPPRPSLAVQRPIVSSERVVLMNWASGNFGCLILHECMKLQ